MESVSVSNIARNATEEVRLFSPEKRREVVAILPDEHDLGGCKMSSRDLERAEILFATVDLDASRTA